MKAKAGSVLIAEPFLNDPNFDRSVVFLCRFNEEGAFGLVLNQTLEASLNIVIPDMPKDIPLYLGGPVDQNTMHFIHGFAEHAQAENQVMQGVYWGGDIEQIFEKLKLGLLDKTKIRFFLGYSGWSGGQLEGEINQNAWIVTDVNAQTVFTEDPSSLWRKVLKDMGGSFKVLSHYPTDPRLN